MHFVKQIVIVLSDGLKTETLSYLFITFSKGNCNYQPTSVGLGKEKICKGAQLDMEKKVQ